MLIIRDKDKRQLNMTASSQKWKGTEATPCILPAAYWQELNFKIHVCDQLVMLVGWLADLKDQLARQQPHTLP
jgi:hypothetical protein